MIWAGRVKWKQNILLCKGFEEQTKGEERVSSSAQPRDPKLEAPVCLCQSTSMGDHIAPFLDREGSRMMREAPISRAGLKFCKVMPPANCSNAEWGILHFCCYNCWQSPDISLSLCPLSARPPPTPCLPSIPVFEGIWILQQMTSIWLSRSTS